MRGSLFNNVQLCKTPWCGLLPTLESILKRQLWKYLLFFTWGDNSVDLLKSQESSAILSPGMSNRIPSRERSGEGHTYPLRNGFKERMIRANSDSKERMYFYKNLSFVLYFPYNRWLEKPNLRGNSHIVIYCRAYKTFGFFLTTAEDLTITDPSLVLEFASFSSSSFVASLPISVLLQ